MEKSLDAVQNFLSKKDNNKIERLLLKLINSNFSILGFTDEYEKEMYALIKFCDNFDNDLANLLKSKVDVFKNLEFDTYDVSSELNYLSKLDSKIFIKEVETESLALMLSREIEREYQATTDREIKSNYFIVGEVNSIVKAIKQDIGAYKKEGKTINQIINMIKIYALFYSVVGLNNNHLFSALQKYQNTDEIIDVTKNDNFSMAYLFILSEVYKAIS